MHLITGQLINKTGEDNWVRLLGLTSPLSSSLDIQPFLKFSRSGCRDKDQTFLMAAFVVALGCCEPIEVIEQRAGKAADQGGQQDRCCRLVVAQTP